MCSELQEWKAERNTLLPLPNTEPPCILWIEAGSACTCPWAAVEGWRMKDVKPACWHLVPISSLWNQSIAIATAAQWTWTQTTALSHTFWTATGCGYIPREAAAGQMPDKRNHCCTYNGIVPLGVAVAVEVLKCNFPIAFSVGQGTFRAQHTRDLRCCPAELYRRPLLFTHIITDSKFLLNWNNNSYLYIDMWVSNMLKSNSCLSTKLMCYFADRINYCKVSLKKGVRREKEMYF